MKSRMEIQLVVLFALLLCWTGCKWLEEDARGAASIDRENVIKTEDRERWHAEAVGDPVKAPEEMTVEQVDQQLYTPPVPAPTLPILPVEKASEPDFRSVLAKQRPEKNRPFEGKL